MDQAGFAQLRLRDADILRLPISQVFPSRASASNVLSGECHLPLSVSAGGGGGPVHLRCSDCFVNPPGAVRQTALDKTETPSGGKTPKEQKTAPKARNDLLPAFTVGMVLLTLLVSAINPVRKVSTRQLARVARSIQRFGFREPPS